jgi:hypothetical protein
MPQVIMLQHAQWINKKRMDVLVKRNRDRGETSVEEKFAGAAFNGKPIDQLTSDEYILYHATGTL